MTTATQSFKAFKGKHLRDMETEVQTPTPHEQYHEVDADGFLTGELVDPFPSEGGEYIPVRWDEDQGRLVGMNGANCAVLVANLDTEAATRLLCESE